jgi:hypothetical protein
MWVSRRRSLGQATVHGTVKSTIWILQSTHLQPRDRFKSEYALREQSAFALLVVSHEVTVRGMAMLVCAVFGRALKED